VGVPSDLDRQAEPVRTADLAGVDALRKALDTANQRLALYEGFDRLIEDQVRRAGETVREVVALRDEASHASTWIPLAAEVDAIAADVQSLARAVASLGERVDRLRASLGPGIATTGTLPAATTEGAGTVDPGSGPSTLDLIVHQVPDTATAVSVQRFVTGLGPVAVVDVREFAEGVLRLRLTVDGPVDASAFASWDEPHRIHPLHQSPTLIELAMEPGKES
jgi:hypothetical protein